MEDPKAMKLKKAAQITAAPGLSTRVETTVAMELAASWKPLMKSNTRATPAAADAPTRQRKIGDRPKLHCRPKMHHDAPLRSVHSKVPSMVARPQGVCYQPL